MHKKSLLVLFVLYLASSLVSYGAFAFLGVSSTVSLSGGSSGQQAGDESDSTALGALLQIEPGTKADQACPLNGKLYTSVEKQAWEKKRPLAVMIENHPDSRPQSGLSDADIVFEALAEGGVTRFMALFYCGVQKFDTTLAPVRSARSYFVDWASGFNFPLYVHVGGANLPGPADALGQINEYGWAQENDLNQFSIGYPTFVRNSNRLGRDVATEHTMETTTELLWEEGVERDWTNMSPARKIGKKSYQAEDWQAGYTPWTFQKSAPADGTVTSISYEFWDGFSQYGVSWKYDAASKQYQRSMAGEAHKDLNDGQQIMASTVIVLFTQEKGPVDELKHMLYTTTGTGKAVVFQNGEAISARWSKKDRESQLVFTDNKGGDLELAPGLIWISVLDDSTEVNY